MAARRRRPQLQPQLWPREPVRRAPFASACLSAASHSHMPRSTVSRSARISTAPSVGFFLFSTDRKNQMLLAAIYFPSTLEDRTAPASPPRRSFGSGTVPGWRSEKPRSKWKASSSKWCRPNTSAMRTTGSFCTGAMSVWRGGRLRAVPDRRSL